jgi:hypothetical protein
VEQLPLLELAFGHIPARVLHVAAELGVADVLAEGPLGYAEVAERTGTDPAVLRRLLRALAGLGAVTQLDGERFELTETGGQLRAEASDSIRDHVLLHAVPEVWGAWGQLGQTVRTGEPARQPDTGLTASEFILRHPDLSATFHAAMAHGSRGLAPDIIRACGFTRFHTVADLGGGDGTLLAAALAAVPDLRGVLYEQPTMVQTAAATFRAAGVADRCEVVAGDFFECVPPGADAYVLKNVIHEWDDERSVALLHNCRTAMASQDRVFLVEAVMPPVITPSSSLHALGDLNMLVWTGGRERTEDDFRRLLDAAGLTVTASTEVVPGYQAIEAATAA